MVQDQTLGSMVDPMHTTKTRSKEMSWGNQENGTHNQHMVSPAGYRLEVMDVDDDAIIALKASNTDGVDAVAIEAEGKVEVTANSDGNPASIGLEVTNASTNINARALKVNGRSEVNGLSIVSGSMSIMDNSEDTALEILNEGGGPSITAEGIIEAGLDGISCEGPLLLGSRQADGYIEGVPKPQPGSILIGTGEDTGTIRVGRVGQTVRVFSTLEVGADEDDPGLIDAELDDEDARELSIGTGNSTADLNLSRAGQDVNVADDLNVGGDCAVVGDLHVGPEADAGMVDSGGDVAIPQDLKVGTGVGTEDVQIGRAGQTIDLFAQARANGNSVILNNALSITAGTGCGLL